MMRNMYRSAREASEIHQKLTGTPMAECCHCFHVPIVGRYGLSVSVPFDPLCHRMGSENPTTVETHLLFDGKHCYDDTVGYEDIKRFSAGARASALANIELLQTEIAYLQNVLNPA
jgi:hypothetical protein